MELVLTGTTPLIMHNPQLSDPDNPIVREIAGITSKRKKTEDDRAAIAKLEWFGGLYLGANGTKGPVVPTANIKRCIVEGAKVNRLGKQIGRAVFFRELVVPLEYEGPRDPEALWKSPAFIHRSSVGINQNRTIRVRPVFPQWRLHMDVTLLTELLDQEDFRRTVELAGQIEGLGDNRVNGYGRFTATLK